MTPTEIETVDLIKAVQKESGFDLDGMSDDVVLATLQAFKQSAYGTLKLQDLEQFEIFQLMCQLAQVTENVATRMIKEEENELN